MRLFDPSRSRAVLIGISRYTRMPDLPAVANNLRGMRDVLTNPHKGRLPEKHCRVIGDDADSGSIGRAVATASKEAQDMLLLYFAGHGLPGDRRDDLYLALRDTDPELPAFSALPFTAISNRVIDSPATVRVMIVDCCFSGRAASPRMGDHFALAESLKVEGLAVLTASPANTVAMVGDMYSEFTDQLIDVLYNGIPGGDKLMTLRAAYQSVKQRMNLLRLPEPQFTSMATAADLALVANAAYGADEAAQPDDTPASPDSSRVLALGPLEPLSVSDAVRTVPDRPYIDDPRPPSPANFKSSEATTPYGWAWRKALEKGVDATSWSAAKAEALRNAAATFNDYFDQVKKFCLGPGRHPESELVDQVPQWQSVLERKRYLNSTDDYRAVVWLIDEFLRQRYRVFPTPPEWPSVRGMFDFRTRSKLKQRWRAYDEYLSGIARCCEPPLDADATALRDTLSGRIPQLSPLMDSIEEVRAQTTELADKAKNPKPVNLADQLDGKLSGAASATKKMDEVLRRLVAKNAL